MPIFRVNEDYIFPPVDMAHKSGLLAVGGDLSPERLVHAYIQGIFPWFSQGDPILWWSPDPRFVLFPGEIRISRSMRQELRRESFSITYDHAFEQVISECSEPRDGQDGTWITPEMRRSYLQLHKMGIAHSVEAWEGDLLAGGLYGVCLGRCFFGESMFTRRANASKTAFIHLTARLRRLDFILIDCQVYTNHLNSLGARPIPREDFMSYLEDSMKARSLVGRWDTMEEFTSVLSAAELCPVKDPAQQ